MPANLFAFSASIRAQNAIAAECKKNPIGIEFFNATDTGPAEILIQEEIGSQGPASASGVAQFLRQNKGKPVNVRINSPGGLVFDGIAIHNALKAHDGPVTTIIEAFAASAATLIAIAGNPARIYDNARFMIHNSIGAAFGNKYVQRELFDILDGIDNGLALTYQAKSGKPLGEIKKMMDGTGKEDGTWLDAKEAKSMGFIDEIVKLSAPVKNLSDSVIRQAKREEARREFLSKAQ